MPRSRPNISALVFSLASDLAQFLRSAFRSRTALVAENLFLRKQLAFYREHKVRPRPLTDAARLSLVLWSRLFEWKNALMIVRPGTFTGWHRKGFKLFWRWKSRPAWSVFSALGNVRAQPRTGDSRLRFPGRGHRQVPVSLCVCDLRAGFSTNFAMQRDRASDGGVDRAAGQGGNAERAEAALSDP